METHVSVDARKTSISLLASWFVSVPSGQVWSLSILFLIFSVHRKTFTPQGQVNSSACLARAVCE